MKKPIVLFLAFSFWAISGNLNAKEKGAELIIQKKDGQSVTGELIVVKNSSLLLLDHDGADVSVDIENVKRIRIVKKSKLWSGAGYGFLAGGIGGGVLGLAIFGDDGGFMVHRDNFGWATFFALIGGTGGFVIGSILGAASGTDKTIHIEGRSDSEIKEQLEQLCKKARVPDYQ